MGRIKPALVLLFFFCFFLVTVPAWAGETLRVGLGVAPAQREVGVYRGSFEVVDIATGAVLVVAAAGTTWTVGTDPVGLGLSTGAGPQLGPVAGPLLFRPVASASEAPLFSLNGCRYRGALRLERTAAGILAVNLVDLEEYLYGVVGEEMTYGAPLEALKAQAVASRSYALFRKATQAARAYDVGTDQLTQRYVGYEAETKPGFARVKAAVDATRGEVMYYRGQLVQAYFHANAGGHTEDSENVWQGAFPYLRGVPSPWDSYALERAPDPSSWPAYTYQWQKVLTREELAARLASWNAARTDRPQEQIPVGEVTEIRLSRLGSNGEPTKSGRVTQVLIRGREGEREVRGETARSLFDLRSTLFDLRPDSQVCLLAAGGAAERQEAEGLRAAHALGTSPVNPGSSTYWVMGAGGTSRELPKIFTRLEFTGRGHGHGVGMSQWGAQGMAAEGHDYRDILEYYFNQNRKDGSLVVGPYRPLGG